MATTLPEVFIPFQTTLVHLNDDGSLALRFIATADIYALTQKDCSHIQTITLDCTQEGIADVDEVIFAWKPICGEWTEISETDTDPNIIVTVTRDSLKVIEIVVDILSTSFTTKNYFKVYGMVGTTPTFLKTLFARGVIYTEMGG